MLIALVAFIALRSSIAGKSGTRPEHLLKPQAMFAVERDGAKGLSPWFDERKESTVAEIEAQLKMREENRKALASFEVGKSFGESGAVVIDSDGKRFFALASSGEGLFSSAQAITSVDQVIDRNPISSTVRKWRTSSSTLWR